MFKRTPVKLTDEEIKHFDKISNITEEKIKNQYEDIKYNIKNIDGYEIKFPAHRFDNDYLTTYDPDYPKWVAAKVNEDIINNIEYLDNKHQKCIVKFDINTYELDYRKMLVSGKFRKLLSEGLINIKLNKNTDKEAFDVMIRYLNILNGVEISYIADMDYFYENPRPLQYEMLNEIPNEILNLFQSCSLELINRIIDIAHEMNIISLKYIACSIYIFKSDDSKITLNNNEDNKNIFGNGKDIATQNITLITYKKILEEKIKSLMRDEYTEMINDFVVNN
jgi:hypothetical protein